MNDSGCARAREVLGDLQGWAEVIFEGLHDRFREPGALEKGALREVRELSWTLRDKLYLLRSQLGSSPREG
jgi:hypothetical protein